MTKIYNILIEIGLIFLIIFTPLAYGSVHPWSIAIFEITAGLMALLWIFKMLANGRIEFTRTPINVFIFLFIAYILLQLYSRYSLLSTLYFHATKTDLLKVISYALIFLVTLNTIKTKRQITRILSIIITTGFIMSIFFLMRYFGAKAPQCIINSDHFAGYLGMIIPLALGFLFVRHQATDNRPQTSYSLLSTLYSLRFLIFFSVVVMGAALFFTMSRGGMFSFIAALLFMAALVLTRKSIKKKGWILSAVVIFLVLTIAWLGATPVIEKILSIRVEITSRYFGGRLPIWQGTLNIIKDYPIFGTGLGTFNYIFPKYQPAQIIAKHYTYAHSDILQLLSEIGIIGFLLFAFCGLRFGVRGFKRFRKRHDLWVVGISIGIFGALASIFVHSFADFNLHITANAILLTLALALFVSILNYKHENRTPHTANRITKYIFCPLAVLLICIFITASIRPALADYYFQKADLTTTANRTPQTEHRTPHTELLVRAIALDPTNAAYHYYLGKLYSKSFTQYARRNTQYVQSALSAYKKAVELNPTNSKYHQSLAWTYGQLADLLARPPQTANRTPLTEHRTSHTANRKPNYRRKALDEFELAISLESNNPYRHRTYAIWLFNHPTEENIERGVGEYKRAIELEPKFTEEALTRYAKYQKDYETLKTVLPNTPENHCKVMDKLLEKGLWKQNEADFREDMRKASYRYPYYKEISRYYAVNQETEKSIRVLEDYLKIDPDCADAHFWIADRAFYSKDYNWEFSEVHHKKAIELDTNNLFYKYWYAAHLTYRGMYAEANNLFNEIIKKAPSYTEQINEFKGKF